MAWPKSSPASRGYGADWRVLREKVLKRDGYVCVCENCRRANRTIAASHVDHVISKAEWHRRYGNLDGVDDMTNLQSLNEDCHKLKGLLEKGYQPRFGCDSSGWPRDPDHPWNRK